MFIDINPHISLEPGEQADVCQDHSVFPVNGNAGLCVTNSQPANDSFTRTKIDYCYIACDNYAFVHYAINLILLFMRHVPSHSDTMIL